MLNGILEVFTIWNKDIHSISFKYYDNLTELLINGHYIITLEKTN